MTNQIDDSLNEREQEILRMMAEGLSNQQIAANLWLSVNTVKWYARSIYDKLGVNSRTQAIAAARSLGLLDATGVAGSALHTPYVLPASVNRFVGRENEVFAIKQMLTGPSSSIRHVTVVGPPGIGKTRLAIEAGAQMMTDFPDGIYLVDLSDVTDADRAGIAISQVIQTVTDEDAAPTVEWLKEHVKERDLLLILDNFEQILSAASLVTELLTISPGLRVLVTSRAPLKIYSEHQLVLEPLTYPTSPMNTVNEDDFSAIALFCERARQRHRGFELTDSNSSYIGQICQQLDGLPLAIELTAAYVSDLSLASIEQQLSDRFALLRSDLQDTIFRHQTLEAAIQWSYTLLPENVQAIFRQLSVFVGGWTVETAAVVLPAINDNELERCLEELVRHHLVTETDDGLRYNMLLSISEFARSLFHQDDNSPDIYHNHAAFFLELAETALENWSGPEQAYWLRRLRIEEMNLQAALQWSFDNHAYAMGVQLVHTLHIFWPAQGQIDTGLQWFEYAQTYLEYLPDDDQVLFLTRMISLHYLKGDFKAVAKLLTLAEKVAPTASGDAELTGVVLANWGEYYSRRGDYAQAELYLKEAINMRLRASGSDLSKGIAASMNNLGVVYEHMERHDDAMAIYEQVLAYHEACNDRLEVAATLLNIGNIALVTSDIKKSISCYQAALDVFVELEHYGELSKIFWGFGEITKSIGSLTHSAQIYGFAEEFAMRMGVGIPDTARESMEDDLEELRYKLRDDHLQTLLQKGADMSLAEAIRLVKELQTPPA